MINNFNQYRHGHGNDLFAVNDKLIFCNYAPIIIIFAIFHIPNNNSKMFNLQVLAEHLLAKECEMQCTSAEMHIRR